MRSFNIIQIVAFFAACATAIPSGYDPAAIQRGYEKILGDLSRVPDQVQCKKCKGLFLEDIHQHQTQGKKCAGAGYIAKNRAAESQSFRAANPKAWQEIEDYKNGKVTKFW